MVRFAQMLSRYVNRVYNLNYGATGTVMAVPLYPVELGSL
jgi:hypothetical protein